MAKIKSRKVSWKPSTDTNVVSYEIYCAYGDAVSYESNSISVPANQTSYNLPGEFSMNVDGNYCIGISCFDNAGNESDIVSAVSFFDFTAPMAPTEVIID